MGCAPFHSGAHDPGTHTTTGLWTVNNHTNFLLSDECQLLTSRKLFTHVMYKNKGETSNLESNQSAGEMIQNQEYLKGAFIFLRPRLIASGTRLQTPDGVT